MEIKNVTETLNLLGLNFATHFTDNEDIMYLRLEECELNTNDIYFNRKTHEVIKKDQKIFDELENCHLLETIMFCHYELNYDYEKIKKDINDYVNQLIKDLKKS